MNKVQLSSIPGKVQELPSGKVRVFFNAEEHQQVISHFDKDTNEPLEDEVVDSFLCDCVDVAPEQLNYAAFIEVLIRDRYSVSDEIAILRQKEDKPEEFEAYNTFAENAKQIAKELFSEVENNESGDE